ncbi:prephenate dehydrogenase/arogenate dehydrogenase family protein [Pyrococcus woesei]|uniref:prephenate dehydrogenase/arogenate dehydrogenase family protein n=1 Tax=Pyrococcus woesei TaxID=2262 RepID=UPI003D2F2563
MRITISGYGKMGKLFGRVISKELNAEVKFYSSHTTLDFSSLSEAYEWSDVIILASTIENIKAQIKELREVSSNNPKDIMIFDIATFKKDVLTEYQGFPREVKVASVHPMFGPGAKSFRGHLFYRCPCKGQGKRRRRCRKVYREAGWKN